MSDNLKIISKLKVQHCQSIYHRTKDDSFILYNEVAQCHTIFNICEQSKAFCHKYQKLKLSVKISRLLKI